MHWINMPADGARREHMESQLARLGIADAGHLRVAAYGPEDVAKRIRPAVVKARDVRQEAIPEVACLCSHLEAIRAAWASSETDADSSGWALVAEDDLVLRRDYDFERVAAGSPEGAELLQLSVMHSRALDSQWKPDPRTMWRAWLPWHYGAQLYMVRLSAIPGCLRLLGLDPALPLHEQPGALDLGALKGAVAVSDDMLFRLFRSFNTRVPFSSGDVGLGSRIHEHHLAEHAVFWRDIDAYTSRPNVAGVLDGFARSAAAAAEETSAKTRAPVA
jgi:hypothetical protein